MRSSVIWKVIYIKGMVNKANSQFSHVHVQIIFMV